MLRPPSLHQRLALFAAVALLSASSKKFKCPTNTYFYGDYGGKVYCVKCPAGQYSKGCLGCKADPHAFACKAAATHPRVVRSAHPLHRVRRVTQTPAPTTPAPTPVCMTFAGHTCPHGKYQNQAKTGKCTKCPMGKWQYHSGKCYCDLCHSGLFQPYEGMTACYSCPTGKFQLGEGKTDCEFCHGCSSGKYSTSKGAEEASSKACICKSCPAGYFSSGQSIKCTQCDAGKFAPTVRSYACRLCGLGYYQGEAAQTSCLKCAHRLSPSETHWAPSTTNKFGSKSSAACIAAKTRNPTKHPTLFPTGNPTGFPTASPTDSPSAAPTLSPTQGPTEAPTAGPTDFPTTGFPSAVPTTQPTTSPSSAPTDSPTLEPSASPTTLPTSVPTASPTPEPTRTPTDEPTAHPSPAPSSAPSAAPTAVPTLCAALECPAGYRRKKCRCERCHPGKFSLGNWTNCRKCAKGSYGLGGGTNKTCSGLCPPGRFGMKAGEKTAECSGHCLPGRYGHPGQTSFACSGACAAGSFGNATGGDSSPSCSGKCRAGRYSASGSTACNECKAGKFQSNAGQSSCMRCAAGYATDKAQVIKTTCFLCPKGRHSNHKRTSCTKCAKGTFASGTGASACGNCKPGQVFVSESEGCRSCEAGKYTASGQVCVLCPEGYFRADPSGTKCSVCPLGYANVNDPKPAAAASRCLACNIGQYSFPPTTVNCTVCPYGYFAEKTAKGHCTACPAGRFGRCQGGCYDEECSGPCAAGRYANSTGPDTREKCQGACPPGKFSISGRVKCKDCVEGRYQALESQSTCLMCRRGTYGNTPGIKSPNCTGFCKPGRYSQIRLAETSDKCQYECEKGKYRMGTMVDCRACPAGKFAKKAGKSKCKECARGRYGKRTGETKKECSGACAKTKGFESNWNRTQCVFSDTLAKKEGLRLRAQAKTKAAQLAKAKQEKAHEAAVQKARINVDSVSHEDTFGRSCNAGYFQTASELSDTAQHVCTACPRGKYQASGGENECKACPVNFTTIYRASVSGTECNVPIMQVGTSYANPLFFTQGTGGFELPKDVRERYKTSTKHSVSKNLCDGGKHEAGYVTVDEKHAKNLFYWFSMSRNSAKTAPVILWLAGGPGLSSLTNLFFDNGPCHVTSKLKVEKNEFSWTEQANVIWLDQPAGVGYSYVLSKKGAAMKMKTVVVDILKFLQRWFDDHTEFGRNDFYVFGDSFAGHFVTALAHVIHYNNAHPSNGDYTRINLKGIGIQNGLMNPEAQFPEYVKYLMHNPFTRNLVPESKLVGMRRRMKKCLKSLELCNFHSHKLKVSKAAVQEHCLRARVLCEHAVYAPVEKAGKNLFDIRYANCTAPPYCYNFRILEAYLGMKSTLKALGVREESSRWQPVNQLVNGDFDSDWGKDYSRLLPALLEAGIRVLVYAGDADYDYNWRGNKAWVTKMKWKHQDAFKASPDQSWQDSNTRQFVGEVRQAHALTFVRIYGAGLLTSMDKPRETLDMLKTWLSSGKFDELGKPAGQKAVIRSDRKLERRKGWEAGTLKLDPVWCGDRC